MRFFNGSPGIMTMIKQDVILRNYPSDYHAAWKILAPNLPIEETTNFSHFPADHFGTLEVSYIGFQN